MKDVQLNICAFFKNQGVQNIVQWIVLRENLHAQTVVPMNVPFQEVAYQKLMDVKITAQSCVVNMRRYVFKVLFLQIVPMKMNIATKVIPIALTVPLFVQLNVPQVSSNVPWEWMQMDVLLKITAFQYMIQRLEKKQNVQQSVQQEPLNVLFHMTVMKRFAIHIQKKYQMSVSFNVL